jgi:hypothetical protein
MIALTLVLVTVLVAVAAVAISLVAFWLKLRKRLWIGSLTQFADLIVSMVHQFRIDETNRQYKFQQEQKALKAQAVVAAAARREKASADFADTMARFNKAAEQFAANVESLKK